MDFHLATSYRPQGDQPRVIGELVNGLPTAVSAHIQPCPLSGFPVL